jgi:hypothetical protein
VAKVLSLGPAGTQIAQVYKDMFTQMVKLAGKYHVDTALSIMGYTRLGAWSKAFQERIQIPAFNNTPVEINDVRVVKLTPGPVGAEHIRLGATPDRRFTVNAVSKGTTGITGDILLDDLYTGGGEKFLRIAIEVTDAQPIPPSRPQPPSTGPRRCGPDGNSVCEGNVCMDIAFGQPRPDHNFQCR